MQRVLKNITTNIFNDFFINRTSNLAEDIFNVIVKNIEHIKQSALKSLHTEDNEEINNFINEYINMKENLVLSFSKYSTYEDIQKCIQYESIFIFKNCQILSNPSDFELIFNGSCKKCQLLKNIRDIEIIKKVFRNDFCDTYLVLKEDMINTTDIINQNFSIFNVPKKYTRDISSLYSLLRLKFGKFIKDEKIKIKFVYELENTDLYRVVNKKVDNVYEIVFSPQNFRYEILRVMLNVAEDEILKQHYYSKIDEEVIFPQDKFINYIASQNYEMYYLENLIAYILCPMSLQKIDRFAFDYFQRKVKGEFENANC